MELLLCKEWQLLACWKTRYVYSISISNNLNEQIWHFRSFQNANKYQISIHIQNISNTKKSMFCVYIFLQQDSPSKIATNKEKKLVHVHKHIRQSKKKKNPTLWLLCMLAKSKHKIADTIFLIWNTLYLIYVI